MTKEEIVMILANSDNEKVRDCLKDIVRDKKIVIAFTGALNRTRMEIIGWLEHYFPVEARPGITKETSLLIVGEKPGSKLERAKKMGITMWSEEDFRSLLTAFHEVTRGNK